MDANAPTPPRPDRLAALLAMLEKEPGDAFCLYGIAQEHAARGAHEQAIAWFDRTIAAEPTHGYAFFHKARSLEALGRVPEAIAVLRAGIDAARTAGDRHAVSELTGFLDELT